MRKAIFYFAIVMIAVSCGNSEKQSAKCGTDPLKSEENPIKEKKLEIIRGWDDFIFKDSIYSLQIKGDSAEYYTPVAGPGSVLYNKGDGDYEFVLKGDRDTLTINIVQKLSGAQKQYERIQIPVKKMK